MIKIKTAKYVGSFVNTSQLPSDYYPEFAFVGRSNVGKSSLINCLLNRKNLAKTSSTPGKTRTLNYFLINGKFYFVDLPGYGFAKVPLSEKGRWQLFVEDYLQNRRQLCGIISLFDLRHPPTALDLRTYEWLRYIAFDKALLHVGTKADKLPISKRIERVRLANEVFGFNEKQGVISFSSKTYEGKKQVWKWIAEIMKTFFA